jgi:hypothetical protein
LLFCQNPFAPQAPLQETPDGDTPQRVDIQRSNQTKFIICFGITCADTCPLPQNDRVYRICTHYSLPLIPL